MAFAGIEGLDFLNNFDAGSFGGAVMKIVGGIFIFVIIAIIVFFVFKRKKRGKDYNKTIHWFEEVNGSMMPIGVDTAVELTIPNTQIRVFYIKAKEMYLPRLTKKMGKNSYWLCIKNNREIVNFSMKNINEDMKESNLDYDHTDMRYAMSNLLELIKRNYRDQSQPWWREYKDVIGLVVLIFVLTLSFIFIISKVATLIDQAGTLINHADEVIQSAKAVRGSGVVAA